MQRNGALRSYDVRQHAPAMSNSYHGDAATVDPVLATLDHSPRAKPPDLSDAQILDLFAFLRSLTAPPDATWAHAPPCAERSPVNA